MEITPPRVAIIDWSKHPMGDTSAGIECAIIGDAAEVRTYLCDSDADFDKEILESSVLIIGGPDPAANQDRAWFDGLIDERQGTSGAIA